VNDAIHHPYTYVGAKILLEISVSTPYLRPMYPVLKTFVNYLESYPPGAQLPRLE